MTPAELVSWIEQRAHDADLMKSNAPVGSVLRTVLSMVQELETNGSRPQQEKPDRMLTAADVATRMGFSRRWVYQHVRSLPFATKYPTGAVRFSEKGLESWLARRK